MSAVIAKPIQPAGISSIRTATGSIAEALELPPGDVQFASVTSPFPTAIDSINFAASGTAEIGDLIRLHGASHFVGRVAVVMSSGARHADFSDRSPLGFTHPITLALYDVDRSEGIVRPGAVLARVTETFLIPWRQENASTGAANRVFLLAFDLSPLGLALPSDVIYSISFNTQHQGASPMGRSGPYDFLALGLSRESPAPGIDVDPNALYWRSTHTGLSLSADPGWAPFRPAVRFQDSLYGLLFETALRLESLQGPDTRLAAGMSLAASLMALALDRDFWDGNAQPSPVAGQPVFDLLAEAADELGQVAAGRGMLSGEAQAALDVIARATGYIAETAVADAVIFGGNTESILRAQAAADLANENQTRAEHGSAIEDFGTAWQEAQDALR